ncbi:hypothetical protein BDN70DRAFT_447492 [Pholiota conissans]|uniref:F-box domain-containing protein n=1 Tax=Pholiota conissans TaxID=109636 RepID=A0A9P5YNM1_9AGAR|nr:hypothetical protein BDN70DRAFT_447492 [Pholiota conissans]
MASSPAAIETEKASSSSPDICNTLPPEILALIFEFACYRPYDERCHIARRAESLWGPNEEGIWEAFVTPLFIGAVCSSWRNITLSTPRLWTQIDVQIGNEHAEAQAEMLRYYLSNSGEHLLTVRLLHNAETNSTEDKLLLPSTAIEALEPHSHRLHTLDTIVPMEWEDALKRIANRLSMLTRLKLRQHNTPSTYKIDFFVNAPRLRDVTLFKIQINSVKLPFAQLERFDFDPSFQLDSFEPLHRCPRLRHCALLTVFLPSQMKHLALETLEIYGDHLKALLQSLELPALRSLLIFLDPFLEEMEQPILRNFFKCSPCALESLTLIYATPDETEFVALLRELPTLRMLEIYNNFYFSRTGTLTPTSLRLMTPRKSLALVSSDLNLEGKEQNLCEPCLVSNLELFYYGGHLEITPRAIVEFLEGRWYRGQTMPKLRSVWFATRPPVEFDEIDTVIVDQLQEEGMHLKFLPVD